MIIFSECHDVNKFGEHCYKILLYKGLGFDILKEMCGLPYTWLSGFWNQRTLILHNDKVEKCLLKNSELQLASKLEVMEDPAVNRHWLLQRAALEHSTEYELLNSELSAAVIVCKMDQATLTPPSAGTVCL